MLLETYPAMDGWTVVEFKSRRLRGDLLCHLHDICNQSKHDGRLGILLDFSNVRHTTSAGITGLIELIARNPRIDFGLCAMQPSLRQKLNSTGLDRHLKLFDSIRSAQSHETFTKHSLNATRAVIRVASKRSLDCGLNPSIPAAALDILGRPALFHIINNLRRFGIRDIIVEAEASTRAILQKLTEHHNFSVGSQGIFFSDTNPREAFNAASGCELSPETIENISCVKRTLIIPGNMLGDIDLGAILNSHQAQNADITSIFSSKPRDLQNTEKTTPIRVIKTQSLQQKAKGLQTHHIIARRPIVELNSPSDYARALRLAAKNVITSYAPAGEQLDEQLWRAAGAKISSRAKIHGFCYAGRQSQIEPFARLNGPIFLGAHARISQEAKVEDCVILNQARVPAHARLRGQLVQSDSISGKRGFKDSSKFKEESAPRSKELSTVRGAA